MVANRWAMVVGLVIFMLASSPAKQAIGQIAITGGQGNSRSLSLVAPSLTLMDGVPGSIAFVTQRPFVTSFVPVIGDYGGGIAPTFGPAQFAPVRSDGISVVQKRIEQLQREGFSLSATNRRVNGSAPVQDTRPTDRFAARLAAAQSGSTDSVESVAAIRQRLAQESRNAADEVAELRRKMSAAEAAGKRQVARVYLKQIERRMGKSGGERSVAREHCQGTPASD